MKILLYLLTATACSLSTTARAVLTNSYSPQTVIGVSPQGTPLALSNVTIRHIGSNVLKITWKTEPDASYVLAKVPVLDTNRPWETVYTVTSSANTNTLTRTVYAGNERSFYRVFKLAPVTVGTLVTWSLAIPNISEQIFTNSTATWHFEDSGATVVVPAKQSVSRTYLYPGMKTVSVKVQSNTNASEVITRYGVHVGASNLISNPEFTHSSNSLPTGYIQGGFGNLTGRYDYPVAGPSGTNDSAARVSVSRYANGAIAWYTEEIPIQPGRNYRFSYMYKSVTSNSVPTDITAGFRTGPGVNDFVYRGLVWPLPSMNWTSGGLTFLTPTNASTVMLFHSLVSTGILTVDNLSLSLEGTAPTTLLPLGTVSFEFDDGWISATNAMRIIENAGFRATYHIVSRYVGSDVLSMQDILAAQRRGNIIGSHTANHAHLTQLPLISAEHEVAVGAFELYERGARDQRWFAYPYGELDTRTKRIVEEAGFDSARSVESGLNVKGSTDRFALKCRMVLRSTSANQVRLWIDEAMLQRQWLILLFHQIDYDPAATYGTTPEVLQAATDHCILVGANVVTTPEGLRLIREP